MTVTNIRDRVSEVLAQGIDTIYYPIVPHIFFLIFSGQASLLPPVPV